MGWDEVTQLKDRGDGVTNVSECCRMKGRKKEEEEGQMRKNEETDQYGVTEACRIAGHLLPKMRTES